MIKRWRLLGTSAITLCLAGAVAAVAISLTSGPSTPGALRVGVLLPLTGPDAIDAKLPLEWALENVNDAGGANQTTASWLSSMSRAVYARR